VLDFFQGLPFRFQQAKVQEHEADAAYGAIEEEGAMEVEGMFNIEERLGTEEQEHVAACRGDAPRETARPAPPNKKRRVSSIILHVYLYPKHEPQDQISKDAESKQTKKSRTLFPAWHHVSSAILSFILSVGPRQ
jgi:hypothetical protein